MNNIMETPLNKVIEEFERLKDESKIFKDAIYLDGVLAVLDGFKKYEKNYIELIKLKIINKTLHKYNEDIKDIFNYTKT